MATQGQVKNLLQVYQEAPESPEYKKLSPTDAQAVAQGLQADHSPDEIFQALDVLANVPMSDDMAQALNATFVILKNASEGNVEGAAGPQTEVAKSTEALMKIVGLLDPKAVLAINKYGFVYKGDYHRPPNFLPEQIQKILTASVQIQNDLTIISNEVLKISQRGQVPFAQADAAVAEYLRKNYRGQSNLYIDYINKQIPELYRRATAGERTDAELVEYRSKYKNLAFQFLDKFPEITAEDLENHTDKAKAAWAWLNGEPGSDRAGEGALSYAEFKPFAEAYNLMRGFPNALRKLVKEQVEFDLTSIPPKDIKGLGKFYEDYQINSDRQHSLLALSRNQKFLNDAQKLAPPFWEFINKSIRAEADSSLAGPKMDAEKLKARIESLSLSEIGELQALNEDFLEPDEDGKPTKTFLDVSSNPKFQQAWQDLPKALKDAIKASVGDQAELFLARLKVEGQKAQLDAQTLKYQTAILGRLKAAGVQTPEDLAQAELDGRLQKIIDSQVGEDGKPIPQEVRKAIMEDFKSQFAMRSAASESINAAKQAEVTGLGLDMALGFLKGNGGGIDGITRNLLDGDSLMGIVGNQMRESGDVPCPAPLRFAGLPRMGGIGGIFGGRGMMGHGRRVDAGGDVVDRAALAQFAMNNPGQLAEKMGGMFTGTSGRQPRPDQRAMEHPVNTAKAETKKPSTRVVAAHYDISEG